MNKSEITPGSASRNYSWLALEAVQVAEDQTHGQFMQSKCFSQCIITPGPIALIFNGLKIPKK